MARIISADEKLNEMEEAPKKVLGLEQKWRILITIMFGLFMIILDSTIVNIAFPTLRAEYGATLSDAQWVISIYVLALGITTPVAGYLADRFHIKRMYLLGLGIFAFGSLLCGLAPSLPLLIAARALQGFGGGIAQPLGPAQLYRAFPPKEQGTAFGILGIALVVAPALGPILGGWLVYMNLWRAIFFINVPIGIIAILWGSRSLRDYRTGHRPLFDPLGFITAAIGFGAVLYAASVAEVGGWTGTTTVALLTLGIGTLIFHAFIELRREEPLLNLRLFKNRIFLNASLVGYVATVALFGAEFLMPLYLISFRGFTALEAGIVLLGVAATSAIATPLAGRLYDKIGPRAIMVTGFAILCVNTWQLAEIKATTPISYIVFLLALRGLAVGLTLQTSYVTALSSIPLDELPRGSSLMNSTRFVVQAISVAALATILVGFLSPQVQLMQQKLQNSNVAVTTTPYGICETPGVPPQDNLPPGASASFSSLPASAASAAKAKLLGLLRQACDQTMQGFEAAYRITFFASIGALILAAFLPGWPGKWGGRASAQPGMGGGH